MDLANAAVGQVAPRAVVETAPAVLEVKLVVEVKAAAERTAAVEVKAAAERTVAVDLTGSGHLVGAREVLVGAEDVVQTAGLETMTPGTAKPTRRHDPLPKTLATGCNQPRTDRLTKASAIVSLPAKARLTVHPSRSSTTKTEGLGLLVLTARGRPLFARGTPKGCSGFPETVASDSVHQDVCTKHYLWVEGGLMPSGGAKIGEGVHTRRGSEGRP
jgi:hypothetical protein